MLSHLLHAPKLPLIFALIAGCVAGLAVDRLGTGRELTVPDATASSKSLVTDAQKDLWGALELATSKKDTEGNDNTVAELFSIWVKKDSEGATSRRRPD